MLQLRSSLIRITRCGALRQHRRYDSSKTSSNHAASTGETKHHSSHSGSANESLGRGFYITIAALSLSLALYKFSIPTDGSSADSAQPAFTRLIGYYSDYNDRWVERNTLHSRMSAQAAEDRNLFQSAPGSQHIDLRFPEIFNTGSPYNVPAGHYANIDEVIAHYKRKNVEANEAIEARMRAAESDRKKS